MSKKKSNLPRITVIGDSTIDNRVWVTPGLKGNFILDHLHLATGLRKVRQAIGYPQTVVENLQQLLPRHEVKDYANDGFTTSDCLGVSQAGMGAYRDKVFPTVAMGPINVSSFPNLFPHKRFKPLEAAADDIKQSKHIILSIGGNNFREWLQGAPEDKDTLAIYIKQGFKPIFEKLHQEYIEIVKQIRALNPDAKIILMTQYYPSASQDNYGIYPFMHELGEALDIGGPSHEAMDVIHEIMKQTYSEIFKKIPTENVVVADLTSSLNPYDGDNHVSQIEPSKGGAKKIAQMLKYLVEAENTSGQVYRFLPEFFNYGKLSKGSISRFTESTPLDQWHPKTPKDFIQEGNETQKLLHRLVELKNNYQPHDPIYQAAKEVHDEANKLQKQLAGKDGIDCLQHSLRCAIDVLEKPKDPKAIIALKENAQQKAFGKLSLWGKFQGALLTLVSAVSFGVNAAIGSVLGEIASGCAFGAGVTMFKLGGQRGLSKSLAGLAKAAEDEPELAADKNLRFKSA